jgi:hypothetical protein
MQFKQLAEMFLHPEKPVNVEPTAYARCYFDRPSAPAQETEEESEEEAKVLQDVEDLKSAAYQYLHPEAPVRTTDPFACGRNYFTRPSAPEQETLEEQEEQVYVLEDAAKLEEWAVDFLHPEMPVGTTDPLACYTNFFDRPSAPITTDAEEEEVARLMEDAKQLKHMAVDYLHPEEPVLTTDPLACCTNVFDRPSAPEPTNADEEEEAERILAEAKELKHTAVDYLHPELHIVTTDPLACYTNFFDRPSAPEPTNADEEEEAERILAEARELKHVAVDYLHPESHVVTTDPLACYTNFFDRPSAPKPTNADEEQEAERILAEARELKHVAVDYLHPEEHVVTTDTLACYTNFFDRPSAPEPTNADEEEEAERILTEARELKHFAVDYLHPEEHVVTIDPLACYTNFFDRPSAPEPTNADEEEEAERILTEARELKHFAVDYLHPEEHVVTTDPLACYTNFFDRPSAPEPTNADEEEEAERILTEVKELKHFAVDYLHPEEHVVATDPLACFTNFFDRPSAPEPINADEEEEFERISVEVKQLKKLAVDYLHPELPVVATDPTACGRNFFLRFSAPEVESSEEIEERDSIFSDAAELKKAAMDYMHPELPVVTSDAKACARCFFDRSSAPWAKDMIYSMGHDDTKLALEYDYHKHFEMDEDIFHDMRSTLVLPSKNNANENYHDDEKDFKPHDENGKLEGRLSCSPSSVMDCY